jgi:hypothetical protein
VGLVAGIVDWAAAWCCPTALGFFLSIGDQAFFFQVSFLLGVALFSSNSLSHSWRRPHWSEFGANAKYCDVACFLIKQVN